MFIFVFFSTTVLLFVNASKSFPANYVALAVAFVMAQFYYSLRIKGKFDGAVKKAFVIIAFVVIAALAIFCLPDTFWAFIPFLKK